MNFADVGANVGLYTGMALATPGFPARSFAWSPIPRAGVSSRRRSQGSRQSDKPRVTVCPVAASDKKETVPFFRNPDNHGDNRLYSESILQPAGQIETDTLDALCERNGISHIEFLKIDIQGAEGRAIAGARGILEASPRVILMTEFWPYGLKSLVFLLQYV